MSVLPGGRVVTGLQVASSSIPGIATEIASQKAIRKLIRDGGGREGIDPSSIPMRRGAVALATGRWF